MYDTTIADIISAVVDEYKDELEGVLKYRALAKKARSEEAHYLALVLSRIENDEFTHAEYLRDYLIHKGVYDPDGKHKDLEHKWLDIIDD
jgi:rubrerythrin